MNGQRIPVSEQEVSAMRERLRKRQEERRAIADVDALVRIVGKSSRPQSIGVIVPSEEAREFCEFRNARKLRGNWRETAVMAAVSGLLMLVSFLAMIG